MFLGRDGVDPQEVEAEFQRLEAEGYERLAAEGIAEMEMDLQRTIDMRYLGQWRSLAIPVSSPLTSLQEAIAAFHDQHEREHGYNRLETPVELYRLNVTAVGLTHKPELARHSRKRYRPSAQSKRLVRFDSVEEWLETPVYRREDLEAGASIEGPAIIEQLDSTVVIPPGSSSEVDDWLNIRIEISLPA
jgi:N-methylhydantoinase A